MNQVLKWAEKAAQQREVPAGAIILNQNGEVVGEGFNKREQSQSPLEHAEIEAIRKASRKLNSWRLKDCTLYSSLEPCLMCMGAILQARISTLVYGCSDPKKGFDSFYQLTKQDIWNHKIQIRHGVLQKECSKMLTDFFQDLRNKKKIHNS